MAKQASKPPVAAETRLVPIDTWEQIHPWPTASGLRTMIYRHDENGADAWIVRVGGRVLVDEAAFFAWAKSKNEPPRRRAPRSRVA